MVGWRTPKNPITCNRCGETFRRQWAAQDYCGACTLVARTEYKRRYHREYYRAHAEEFREQGRRNRANNRERYRKYSRDYMRRLTKTVTKQVFEHYSNGPVRCTCCGEARRDFLTLDHVEGIGHGVPREPAMPRAGTSLYIWLARHNYLEGFQILCMNCNLSKAKHGACVHQSRMRQLG